MSESKEVANRKRSRLPRVTLLVLGVLLLIVAGLLLLRPPQIEVPAAGPPVAGAEATVTVDADYETAAIVAGIAGCFFLLLGALNLRPAGLSFAGTQVNFGTTAEVIDRQPGDREALVKKAAVDLEAKVLPSEGRSKTDPGLEADGPAVQPGDEASAALKDVSVDGVFTLSSQRHWEHLFPWVREIVEEWALENGSDISVAPSTRIVGAQRLGEGEGNFSWKVDLLSDSGEVISLRATQGRGGKRFSKPQ